LGKKKGNQRVQKDRNDSIEKSSAKGTEFPRLTRTLTNELDYGAHGRPIRERKTCPHATRADGIVKEDED